MPRSGHSTVKKTECFGAQEVEKNFLWIIYLIWKGTACFARSKNSFAIFWAWRTYIHFKKNHTHTKNLVQDVEDLFPVLKAPTLFDPRSWIFFPVYCIFCILPLLRFQIGAKLEISQNCRWKFLCLPGSQSFLPSSPKPATITISPLLYQPTDKFSSSKSPSSSISNSQRNFIYLFKKFSDLQFTELLLSPFCL